jgi:antibiotic biosynthesis monooxygenase (ABM) superfamily enzyme
MALVAVIGVWPASMLVSWLRNSLGRGMPFYPRSLLVALGIVALLTWLVRSPRDT